MKSGLLMSMPSAIHATLTPAPVARLCACGVEASLKAVLVVCSASGSSSGLAGSLGQMSVDAAAAFRALGDLEVREDPLHRRVRRELCDLRGRRLAGETVDGFEAAEVGHASPLRGRHRRGLVALRGVDPRRALALGDGEVSVLI